MCVFPVNDFTGYSARECPANMRVITLEPIVVIDDSKAGVPIILCTGSSERVTEDSARKAEIIELAMNPMDRRQLAEIVRTALHEGER